MKGFEISGRVVGDGSPCFVIAEAGFNHDGSLEAALRLVEAAKAAGADAVKFQSFNASDLTLPGTEIHRIIGNAVLNAEELRKVREHARKTGILFASTPFSTGWVRILAELDVDFLKIASMDITTPPILEAAGATRKPIILSTGLATVEESRHALSTLRRSGASDIAVLHCVSLYPCPPEETNLRAIRLLREELGVPIGFSDHTLDVSTPAFAVVAGASIIEKHFTLDRNLPGPDHSLGLDPPDFKRMVEGIRGAEKRLGPGDKTPSSAEEKGKAATRRAIAASREIPEGRVISADDLIVIRPESSGIPSSRWHEVLGRKAKRRIERNEFLKPTDVS